MTIQEKEIELLKTIKRLKKKWGVYPYKTQLMEVMGYTSEKREAFSDKYDKAIERLVRAKKLSTNRGQHSRQLCIREEI